MTTMVSAQLVDKIILFLLNGIGTLDENKLPIYAGLLLVFPLVTFAVLIHSLNWLFPRNPHHVCACPAALLCYKCLENGAERFLIILCLSIA
jgi:hypothetical protein